jgi:hypothetical protein
LRDPALYENKTFPQQSLWRMDVGTELHELVQRRLGSTGKLFGTWECSSWCNEKKCIWYGFKPTVSLCPNDTPHKENWVYSEVLVVDEDYCIRGSTDGIVVLDTGKYVFEFKTINAQGFGALAEPIEDHKRQALLYLYCLQNRSAFVETIRERDIERGDKLMEVFEAERMPYKGAIVVYMNKDTQEFKEYVVPACVSFSAPKGFRMDDEELSLDWVSQTLNLLEKTLELSSRRELCARLDKCETKSSYRATRCFAREACFAEEK